MSQQVAEYDGLCPVALSEGTDFQGSEEFASVIGEKRYLFGSADGKQLFDADPQAILEKIKR